MTPCILIPCYNHAGPLAAVLARLAEYALLDDPLPFTTLDIGGPDHASNAEVGTLKTRAIIASTSGDWHPSRPWWLSGRVSAKWQDDRFEGGTESSFRGQWLSGRIVYDLGKRWDVGIAAACGTVERDELGGAFGHAEACGGLGGMKIDDGQVERFVG